MAKLTGAVTALGSGWDTLVQRLEYDVAQGRYEKASATLQVADWQAKLSQALEEAGDFLAYKDSKELQLASGHVTALLFYTKALEAIEAARAKEPDNQQLLTRKALLAEKVNGQQSVAQ